MKLSKVQHETLAKMLPARKYCARDLRCSLSTLRALERCKLVESRHYLGCLYSPRTDILFRLTEAGKEAKEA